MAREGTITLKELQKENAAEQAKADKAEEERLRLEEEALGDDDLDDDDGQAGDADQDTGDDGGDPDADGDGDAEGEDSEGDPDDDDQDPDKKAESKNNADESWMLDDEGKAPDPEKKYTDTDAKHIRQKYKGKINDLKDENEELRRQIETAPRGQKQITGQNVDTSIKEPARADFKDDMAYLEARQDYKMEVHAAEQETRHQSQQVHQKQTEAKQNLTKAVDAHYMRADQLVTQSGIAPEKYQQADTIVRQALDSVFPEAGDGVVDSLIARMGEGSEKVIFNLGVNAARRTELLQHLRDDPSGIAAAVFLGDLKGKLAAPAKRQSQAPAPGKGNLNGDGKGEGGKKRALLKKYREAHKKNDGQSAFNAKKEAKALGIDVSKW